MNGTRDVDHSKCWANPLGNCAGGMSREHTISRNQFGSGLITIQGLPWCRDEPREVGIDSLTSKILCQHHNNSLSPLDEAAAETLGFFKAMGERRALLAAGRPRQPRQTFRVSGDHLERWLLKTTINIALQARPVPTGGIFEESGRPARRYIDVVFGGAHFDATEGLTWVAQIGEQIAYADQHSVRFETWLRREDNALVAAFMTFHGHRLWLATAGAPEIKNGLHPIRVLDVWDLDIRLEFEWSKR